MGCLLRRAVPEWVMWGGCVPSRGGLVIRTMDMNRILEVNPAEGVAVVQPGVLTADLQSAVAAVG